MHRSSFLLLLHWKNLCEAVLKKMFNILYSEESAVYSVDSEEEVIFLEGLDPVLDR